jgi:hypothetical protein
MATKADITRVGMVHRIKEGIIKTPGLATITRTTANKEIALAGYSEKIHRPHWPGIHSLPFASQHGLCPIRASISYGAGSAHALPKRYRGMGEHENRRVSFQRAALVWRDEARRL